MSTYEDLISLLQPLQTAPLNTAVQQLLTNQDDVVQNTLSSATLRDWSKAIHTTWIDSITLEQLQSGLESTGRFSQSDINTEANIYFLEIVIHVDTNQVISKHQINGSAAPIFVDGFVKMTSNHVDTTIGQNTNELDAEALVANESIQWTALGSDGAQNIQLKSFHASPVNRDADFSKIISTPVLNTGSTNQYSSYVIPTPQANFRKAYSFDFTINNGTQLFTFDPFIGTLIKR
jgi:hypothetical protein